MAKNKEIFIQEFKARPLDWLIRIVTVLILILGSYITIRLVPVYQNINQIVSEIKAINIDVAELQTATKEHSEIFVEVKALTVKMDDMSARLERIDNRLSKHLGI